MTSFSFFKYFDAFELDVNIVNFVYYGKTRLRMTRRNDKQSGRFRNICHLSRIFLFPFSGMFNVHVINYWQKCVQLVEDQTNLAMFNLSVHCEPLNTNQPKNVGTL